MAHEHRLLLQLKVHRSSGKAEILYAFVAASSAPAAHMAERVNFIMCDVEGECWGEGVFPFMLRYARCDWLAPRGPTLPVEESHIGMLQMFVLEDFIAEVLL